MPVKAAAGYAEVLCQSRNPDRVDSFRDENLERTQQPVDSLQLFALWARNAAIRDFFEQAGV
jgi:hypothetical protein